jgi:hypothetical protein
MVLLIHMKNMENGLSEFMEKWGNEVDVYFEKIYNNNRGAVICLF